MGEKPTRVERAARHRQRLKLEYPCRLARGGWSLGCRAQRYRRVTAVGAGEMRTASALGRVLAGGGGGDGREWGSGGPWRARRVVPSVSTTASSDMGEGVGVESAQTVPRPFCRLPAWKSFYEKAPPRQAVNQDL